MKKFIMTIAGAAAFLFATQVTAQETNMAVDTKTEVQAPVQQEAAMQDNFVQIDAAELPQAVQEAVATDYEDAAIAESYVDSEKQIFKLVLQAEGAEAMEVYANANGEWLKPKK